MKLLVKNVLFQNVQSKTDAKGNEYFHAYLKEPGTREAIQVNVDKCFLPAPTCPVDVELNYRFSVVEKGGTKYIFHNFDVSKVVS